MKRHLSVILVLLSGMTSCAVTPDFNEPTPPQISQYTRGDHDAVIMGTNKVLDSEQTLVWVDTIEREWWRQFHSETLNQLVEKVLSDNPGLLSSSAKLRSAEELDRKSVV